MMEEWIVISCTSSVHSTQEVSVGVSWKSVSGVVIVSYFYCLTIKVKYPALLYNKTDTSHLRMDSSCQRSIVPIPAPKCLLSRLFFQAKDSLPLAALLL